MRATKRSFDASGVCALLAAMACSPGTDAATSEAAPSRAVPTGPPDAEGVVLDAGASDGPPIDAPPTEGVPDESGDYPPWTECAGPSLDRLQRWWGTGEGPTDPGPDRSLLTMRDGRFVAQVTFAYGPNWHVAPVWITNAFEGTDLSSSRGLRIRYSATSSFYVQLRGKSRYSGGDKWHTSLPATGGSVVTRDVPFVQTAWSERLGTPPQTLSETLREVLALVLVGDTNNRITIESLRIAGYSPPCR